MISESPQFGFTGSGPMISGSWEYRFGWFLGISVLGNPGSGRFPAILVLQNPGLDGSWKLWFLTILVRSVPGNSGSWKFIA